MIQLEERHRRLDDNSKSRRFDSARGPGGSSIPWDRVGDNSTTELVDLMIMAAQFDKRGGRSDNGRTGGRQYPADKMVDDEKDW